MKDTGGALAGGGGGPDDVSPSPCWSRFESPAGCVPVLGVHQGAAAQGHRSAARKQSALQQLLQHGTSPLLDWRAATGRSGCLAAAGRRAPKQHSGRLHSNQLRCQPRKLQDLDKKPIKQERGSGQRTWAAVGTPHQH